MNIENDININQIDGFVSASSKLSDFSQIIHSNFLNGELLFLCSKPNDWNRAFKRLYFWLNTLCINVQLKLFTKDKNSKASTIGMLSQGYKLYM